MTAVADRYYRSSGSVPLAGVFFAIGPTIAITAILALGYSAIACYNPFIFLTFIATAGFALGVAFTLQFFLQMGKVRNRPVGVLLSLIAGVFAVYAAWVAFIWIFVYRSEGVHLWLFDPADVLMMVKLLAVDGIWEIKGHTPTGWELYTVWIVEASLIVGLPVLTSLSKPSPFCESCKEWSRPTVCAAYFALPESPDELVRDLENENYEPLHHLTKMPYNLDDRLHVTVHECPNCDATWMSAERIIITTDKDGEEDSQEIPIVTNLVISSEEGDLLKGLTNFAAEPASSDQAHEHESEPGAADEA